MLIIGLTGGIGSGKTLVSDIFKEFSVPVIDADVIARQITAPNTRVCESIREHFGDDIFHGNNLDRKKLRDLIFRDKSERLWLETLLHPLIETEIKRQLAGITAPYCILSIPLLLEKNSYSYIDRILVIDADEQTQIRRVRERDNLSEEVVRSIMTTQLDRVSRLAYADDIIENNGNITELKAQVRALHQKYTALSYI